MGIAPIGQKGKCIMAKEKKDAEGESEVFNVIVAFARAMAKAALAPFGSRRPQRLRNVSFADIMAIGGIVRQAVKDILTMMEGAEPDDAILTKFTDSVMSEVAQKGEPG